MPLQRDHLFLRLFYSTHGSRGQNLPRFWSVGRKAQIAHQPPFLVNQETFTGLADTARVGHDPPEFGHRLSQDNSTELETISASHGACGEEPTLGKLEMRGRNGDGIGRHHARRRAQPIQRSGRGLDQPRRFIRKRVTNRAMIARGKYNATVAIDKIEIAQAILGQNLIDGGSIAVE